MTKSLRPITLITIFLFLVTAGCSIYDGNSKKQDGASQDALDAAEEDVTDDKFIIPEDVPECIRNSIEGNEDAPPELFGPLFIHKYTYEDQIVYYVYSTCCDRYNYLVDTECGIICAPDGGISGAGDGRCPEFVYESRDCELVWESYECVGCYSNECSGCHDCQM